MTTILSHNIILAYQSIWFVLLSICTNRCVQQIEMSATNRTSGVWAEQSYQTTVTNCNLIRRKILNVFQICFVREFSFVIWYRSYWHNVTLESPPSFEVALTALAQRTQHTENTYRRYLGLFAVTNWGLLSTDRGIVSPRIFTRRRQCFPPFLLCIFPPLTVKFYLWAWLWR